MPSPWVRSLFPARKTLKSLRACCIRILYGFLNWLHFSTVEAPQHHNYRKSSIKPPPPEGGLFYFQAHLRGGGGLFILEKTIVSVSGGSRPGDNGGPGHPDPEIKWGGPVWKKIFSALWASVWSKNKRAPPPPPGPSPWSDTVSSP